MKSQIEEALASGYSPAEVLDYLSKSKWQDKSEQISKAKEAGYSPDEILNYLTPQKIETAGPIEAVVGSTKRMASDIVTGAQLPFSADDAAMRGISRQKDITEKSAGSLEAVKQAYEDKGVLGAVKEIATQAPGVLAEQAPLIGSMALGARAGAFAGPYGALAGSVLLPLLSYAGASAERKAEEQISKGEPVDIDAAGAFASGAGQAALDRLSLGFSGLARVFGISAKELATEAGAKLAKESLGKALAKGTLKTELAEIPTEIAQQAIERFYAGLPLTGEDALKEYGDIAYQTSLMGPLGGAGRVYERGEQRDIIKTQEQTQQRELNRIQTERDRINQIVLDAQNEAEILKAKEEAKKFAVEELNTLGNKAPEKSKIAKSIANMEASFNKAIEQKDLDAQKAAIAELTDVPTNIVSLAQQYEAKPTDVISPQTFKNLNIGPTAVIRKSLTGLDPLKLEDNLTIRNSFEAFLKNKEDDAPQSIAIRNYLETIPKPEELQDEAAVVEGSREGVQVPGQPMAGEIAGGVKGVDGAGLGSATDNVQQLAGREGPRPAPLASETTEVLPSANEMIKNYKGDTLFEYLHKKGGIDYSNIAELTGEDKIPNRRGAFSLFRREGGKDIIEMIESGDLDKYLPYDAKVQGGSQEFSGQPFDVDPAIDYLSNAFKNNEDIRDYEFETELANVKNQEKEFERQASIPSDEEVNKDIKEIAAETQGRDVLFAEPKQQLGERNPIFDKVTNAKQLFKAVMKIADTRSDKAIINMLEKVPNLETVKVITENTSTNPELQGAAGYYDPNTNTIFVDPRVTNLSHITLHEILHAATDAEFDKHVKVENDRHTAITPLGKKAVKLFESFMDASLKRQEGFYGQKNIKEFFMEGNTDPKLKQFLQNQKGVLGLKPAKGKVATLWSDFVNLIKSMFGIPEYAHSMLDEILLLSPEFMKGPGAITTGKEIVQARQAPEGMTRPDGTPLKYIEDTEEGIVDKFKNVFNNDTNQWRKWMDQLGNRIVGGRYSVERKALDANLPEVDRFTQGRIRGDLINLQAYNSMSLAQSGLYVGRLIRRKTGLIVADQSSGEDKVKMMDISNAWNELVDKATQELGSKELAYDMLVAGYYGPRYAKLAEFNETASADEKVNISEWTESDKKTAEEAYKRYGTELKRLQDMRNVQRKDLLDFMVDTGLYTREKANKFLDRSEYVALYRVPEEELDSFDRPIMRGKGLLGAGKEYRLVGSKRAAADPIDNYIANMTWMMQRGIKNNAAKATADMMQQLEIGEWFDRPMTDIEKKAYNHVTIHVDGLPKDFRVEDANDMAAFSAAPVAQGFIWDVLKRFSSALRHGVTMFPQFVINQVNEDPIRATFTSGNKAGFLKNIKNTWVSVAKNQFNTSRTPNAELLYRYGIVGQRDILDSKDVIDLYKGKDKSRIRKSLFFFERMAQGADLGAREAIFQSAVDELVKEGYDLESAQDYAAVRAHQYMPYQQVGTSRTVAYLRAMMPFVNPPIQGLARDIAAARGRIGGVSKAQGKKMLTYRVAKYAMFTAMYAAFMSGDDDYENQSEDLQDNNFFIGGFRAAVPQEIRPLKVAVERGTRAWVLNAPRSDETPEIFGTIIRKTWEIVAGFMPVPTAFRPALETKMNYNLFSNLPVVGAGQQRKEPYLQYTENTSELAKVVGAQLNYSPIKIDHLLKGYFGYLGSTVGQMSNYLSGDRPAPTANDIIFIGSMIENPRATGNRGDFYDLYDKVSTVKASAQALKDQGDVEGLQDYMQENKGYIAVAPTVNNLHNQLNKLRQYRKQVMNSDMSPKEKRETLDGLTESENNMLSNIKELYKQALEINKQD